MIDENQLFYFSSIDPKNKFWQNVHPKASEAGKFYIDITKRLNPHRFCSRDSSEWSMPWNQTVPDKFKMLDYDPNFNKTFEEVTDEHAYTIKSGVQAGKKYALMYSGGMDSTCTTVALLKNLTKEELKSVAICCSIHSIIENPIFWKKHLDGKFKIFDSNEHLYEDYINMGYTPITSDEGDCIFGTSIGLQLYHNYDYYVSLQHSSVQDNLLKLKYKISDSSVHYTAYKDILIRYFSFDETEEGLKFGKLLYEKYHRNILTCTVPVYSLHDFFWWLIFNVKYINCSLRGAAYYSGSIEFEKAMNSIENWFNAPGYQYWSMVNNNNGMKIRNTISSYKQVQREYIRDFDKNDWYFFFKTKLESLNNLNLRGKNNDYKKMMKYMVGVTDNYEYFCIPEEGEPIDQTGYKGKYREDKEVKEFYEEKMINFKLDWLND